MDEKFYVFSAGDGSIPFICVTGETLPEAWENALLAVWHHGTDIRTEYDRQDKAGNFIDPPSKDASVCILVERPFAEPRIHKNLPCGLEGLYIYIREVLDGIHDHWIDLDDNTKWKYTYHERIAKYLPRASLKEKLGFMRENEFVELEPINQLEQMLMKLSKTPYTRRAQAITWIPHLDYNHGDPPCLQRIWCRLLRDNEGTLTLNMNTHWRSRDLYKALFVNSLALTEWQARIANQISELTGEPVKIGRYLDISDSLHIYGSYFSEVEPEIRKIESNPDYRERAWRSDDELILAIFEETAKRLEENVDFMLG